MLASSNPAFSRLAQEIRSQLAPQTQQWGVFLEDVAVSGTAKSPTIRVFIDLPDGPGQLDSTTLEQATCEISKFFDKIDPLPGTYTLEVSTPGADRQLTTPRHWRRSVGLRVHVSTASEGEKTGTVVGVDIDNQRYTLELNDENHPEARYEGSLLEVKSAQVVLDWSRA